MPTISDRLRELGEALPRGWQAGLARHCGVKPPSVADWVSGKTKSLEGDNLLRAAEYFKVHPNWLANGRGAKFLSDAEQQELQEAQPDPSLVLAQDAIDVLANVLGRLDGDGKEHLALALARFAKDPQTQRDRVLRQLELALNDAPTTEPPPGSPTPSRKTKTEKASERRGDRATLVLKLGGDTQQYSLPLPPPSLRAVPTEKDASPRELAWYERIKSAPKAKT